MTHRLSRQGGATIIEVLVAVILVVVGLLGLAGLQSRVSLAEVEAFQRAQAIVLVQDMVSRINANRRNVGSYVTGTSTPKGTDVGVQDCSALTGAALDLCEWNNELVGVGETSGSSSVGGMLGARGCVETVSNTMPYQVRVSVVWQGTVATTAPGATTCGSGLYSSDSLRRAITANVEIGCLRNDPASTLCISGIPAF